MLWCVGGFGFFTILFGISRSIVLSLIALFFVGATDMVSVIVRAVLIQVATPDEMRGRVNAVDMVFIGASNEFGEFESGLTAQWFGTAPRRRDWRNWHTHRDCHLGVAFPGVEKSRANPFAAKPRGVTARPAR